jgi:hypothetical protein
MKKGVLFLGLFLAGIMLMGFANAITCDPGSVGWYSGACWKCNSAGNGASTIDPHNCNMGPGDSGQTCPAPPYCKLDGNCYPSGTLVTYGDGTCRSCCSGTDSGRSASACSGCGGGGGGGGTVPTEPAPTCGGSTPCGNYPSCSAKKTWYLDADNDGYYTGSTQSSCSSPGTGWKNSATAGDCNDSNSGIKPGAIEICNGQDDNCDSQVDEGDVCISIWTPFWANLRGQMISNSQAGDTVMMIAAGLGFNQEVNYSVYKNSTFLWFFHRISPLSQTSSSDVWTSSTSANGVYFTARVASKMNYSGSLDIGSASNSPPIANITYPISGLFWSVDTPLSFTQESYDDDDLLKLTWNFGDNANHIITNYSIFNAGSGNTYHNYTSAGFYRIELIASEMTRTSSSSDKRVVYILQPGINVISIISSPNASTSYGNWVNFNASTSFVVNCTKGVITNRNFTAGDLNCTYIHAPLQKTITGNYDLRLNWTVYDSAGRMELGFPRIGSWKNNYSYIVDYPVYFDEAEKRNAILSITYY